MCVNGYETWLVGSLPGQVPRIPQDIVQLAILISTTDKHQSMPSDGSRGSPVKINTFQKSHHHHKGDPLIFQQ